MTEYLTLEDALRIAELTLGRRPEVRDLGLLDAAVHRPRTSLFGADAYPDLHTKAAALLESAVRNHALIDGNKRLGWMLCYDFYALNGQLLAPTEDDAYDFVIAVVEGKIELAEMAAWLAENVTPRT
ncbi:type II toxin-antitoxin system death-on-curing family toxin [Jiangella alkaliphila]|uniref:Death on curing protein n=1 Tax=Jiangella alkaliphila TaxID=419479 RepID=A0A1H2IJ74_9ACTN|nr:Fic family protein [Jiangella alkaliphila]SDU43918.1 death on curing protein [Jiangella alkaliphila]